MNADEMLLLRRYRALTRAIVAKDRAKLKAMIADNFQLVGIPGGGSLSKAGLLYMLRKGTLNVHSMSIPAPQVSIQGSTGAVHGRSTRVVEAKGKKARNRSTVMSTWHLAERPGTATRHARLRWVLVAAHLGRSGGSIKPVTT